MQLLWTLRMKSAALATQVAGLVPRIEAGTDWGLREPPERSAVLWAMPWALQSARHMHDTTERGPGCEQASTP